MAFLPSRTETHLFPQTERDDPTRYAALVESPRVPKRDPKNPNPSFAGWALFWLGRCRVPGMEKDAVQDLIVKYTQLYTYVDLWQFCDALERVREIQLFKEYNCLIKAPMSEAFQVISSLAELFGTAGKSIQGTHFSVLIKYTVKRIKQVVSVEIDCLQKAILAAPPA